MRISSRKRPTRLSRTLSRGLAKVAHGVYRGPVRRAIAERLARQRRVTRPTIALARGGSELDGLRLAFLSDLHAGNYFAEDDWLRVCEAVAAESPDLVCLGGDLVNAFEHEARLLRKGLGLLAAPLGVFAVPGNHEYQASDELELWRAALEESGVEILCNRGRRLARGAAGLWLCGVDDLRRGEPDLGAALEGRAAHEPAVLLSHHPDLFVDAARAGVDLQLSGHTHGGQIVLRGWAPMTHSRFGFRAGHFTREGAQLYVGSGVGTTFLPLRIGAPAEIALVELRMS
jgi:predicted MPP superfamily phosphohydrolase